jgi:hypothetical protein
MSQLLRKSVALLLLMSLLCLPLATLASGGKDDQIALAQQQKAALETLSEYMTGHADWAERMLQKYCYEPPVAATAWQHYPAVRKLVIAYEAAEAANPGVGGDMLLALLSQALAQQYEAVRLEGSLIPYLNLRVSKPPCIEFRNPEKRVFFSELPPEVADAIKTIAIYSTGGALGSPQAVLRLVLKESRSFTEDAAEGFLCQSDTVADAFVRAFSYVPEEKRAALLEELTARLVPHNEAARFELSLKSYLPENRTDNQSITRTRPRRVNTQPTSADDYSVLGAPLADPLPTPTSSEPLLSPSLDTRWTLNEEIIEPALPLDFPSWPPPIRIQRVPETYGPFSTSYEPVITPMGPRVDGLRINTTGLRGNFLAPLYPPILIFAVPYEPPPIIRADPLPRRVRPIKHRGCP